MKHIDIVCKSTRSHFFPTDENYILAYMPPHKCIYHYIGLIMIHQQAYSSRHRNGWFVYNLANPMSAPEWSIKEQEAPGTSARSWLTANHRLPTLLLLPVWEGLMESTGCTLLMKSMARCCELWVMFNYFTKCHLKLWNFHPILGFGLYISRWEAAICKFDRR